MLESPSVDNHYTALRRACSDALAVGPEQWAFKSDPRFTEYLEHTTLVQADEILAALEPTFLHRLVEIATVNDAFGQPARAYFPELDRAIAPTNLRWMWQALLLLRHLRKVSCIRPMIIEIGAGYGAMALYTLRLADLFGIQIQRYVTVDIPEVAKLQAAFCSALDLPVTSIDGTDGAALEVLMAHPEQKVAFSAYAFAEFIEPVQDWYVQRVLRHCDHGFIVWNTYGGWAHRGPNPYYKFMDRPVSVVADDIPSFPDWDMKDVVW